MPELKIFTGNVGCGKSFLASKFAKRFNDVIVNMDSIQQMVSGGEYGRYDSTKKEVYHAAENAVVEQALSAGLSVVVDRTNMDRKRRKRFIEIGGKYGADIISYDWGKGSVDALARRIATPRGISEHQWLEVQSFMETSYEKPSRDEGFSDIVEAPTNFKFHAFDFDGTLVENKFPSIGEVISGRVDQLNRLYKDISNVVIIWTCRDGDYKNQMRNFLIKNKIPFDFINENPLCGFGSRKVFAHRYYDDRCA